MAERLPRVQVERVLTFYEPRWHGFAWWVLEEAQSSDTYSGGRGWYMAHTIKQGWWRPPRGWKYRQLILNSNDVS